jgi:hypothetical protein
MPADTRTDRELLLEILARLERLERATTAPRKGGRPRPHYEPIEVVPAAVRNL